MAEVSVKRSYKILILFMAVLVLGTVYLIFDPAETSWMPKCPVHTLIGLDCPGCGSQRAFHSLLHGDLAGAARANALLFLIIPVLMTIGIAELTRNRFPNLFKFICHPYFIGLILASILLWTLVRNIYISSIA